MNDHLGICVSYDKNDIIKDCRYCSKSEKKGKGEFHAYGYQCALKREKRRANRCRHCYFGH